MSAHSGSETLHGGAGCSGLELARAIKADPMLAPTQLILLTFQGERGDAQVAQAAGDSAYLTKSLREAQLQACLVTLALAPTADHPALLSRHSLAEATARILIAEDNIVNQKVAVRMLERLGYRVDLAANGLEALNALKQIPYDAILMDCQMPEMDGFEATAEIRRRQGTGRRIP